MSKEIQNNKPKDIVLYQTDNTNICVSVYYSGETFWLSQKAMAELFGCSTDNISLHLKNIFAEGELDKDSVTEKYSATAADGKNYLTTFYNLDAIIAVGYRVNSKQATAFRIWATQALKEYYIIKGTVSYDQAIANAVQEYEIFRVRQDQEYISEFDKEMEKYLKGNNNINFTKPRKILWQ